MASKLTKQDKERIVDFFNKKETIVMIAHIFSVSTRTIGRVLDEMGEARPMAQAKGQAYQVMQVLKKHGVQPDALDLLITTANKGPAEVDVIKFLMNLDEAAWGALLNTVVTSRVAKASNVHVQTRMLQLEEKVKANERESKARG